MLLDFGCKREMEKEWETLQRKMYIFKGHAVSEGAGDASDIFSL